MTNRRIIPVPKVLVGRTGQNARTAIFGPGELLDAVRPLRTRTAEHRRRDSKAMCASQNAACPCMVIVLEYT
jgi:hypothetical protein